MRTTRSNLLAIALLAAAAAPARAADESPAFEVAKEKSELTVHVFKEGFLSGLGHDHTIRATDFAATIRYDAADPARGSVELTVQAGSLEVVDEGADADDRAAVEKNMDAEVLEVEDHPRIVFRSRKVEVLDTLAGGHVLRVSGDLSLHGKTRRIRLDVTLTRADGELTAKGSVRLLQTDYDIEPYSAFLGAVKVKDEIELAFTLRAAPAAAKKSGEGS